MNNPKEEVDLLWPLSENYEYVAELGMVIRVQLPLLWEEWWNGERLTRFPLPQALAFQFFLHCEKEYPEELREILPSLIARSPIKLQREWQASLSEATTPGEDYGAPLPESLPPLFFSPDLISYNEQSERIHRWNEEIWPDPIEAGEEAAERDLQRVHHGSYLRGLADLASRGGGPLTPETLVQEESWHALLLSSGVMIEATRHALQNGLALAEIIPGSHHAGHAHACGTCLANHLAVAAEWVRGRRGINRVAILDIDAHHGNGTEEIFWSRGDMLTVSVHQEAPFFPGTGSPRDIGAGEGRGANINIETRGREWAGAAGEGIGHVARFDPDIIFLQWGSDAHISDGASDLEANWEDFRGVGESLAELRIPLVVELGAGTNPEAWQQALRGFLLGLDS